MLPDLAIGRISAPSLPETLSHIHLKKLLRYVPGMSGSGVCCCLVGQSVWLLVCHRWLSVPFLWLCHCTHQFGKSRCFPHGWELALALSTPGLALTTAWPSPEVSPSCASHVPSPELPRPGQAGFPINRGREGQALPTREGRQEETFWKVPWYHLSFRDALAR